MRQLLANIGRRVLRVTNSLLAQQNGGRILFEDGSSIIVE